MKTTTKITVVIIMMIAAANISFAGKTETIIIKTSMQCDMCKERIEKTLQFEKGVKKISFNMDTKEVSVTYLPKKTSPEKLRAAIAKTGYDADDVKADAKSYEKLPGCCKKPEGK